MNRNIRICVWMDIMNFVAIRSFPDCTYMICSCFVFVLLSLSYLDMWMCAVGHGVKIGRAWFKLIQGAVV